MPLAAQAVGQIAYGVGRVQRLHHFEAIAGTVTEKDSECWLRRSPQTRISSAAFPVASDRVEALF
jgi:hypothetical protein